jgi:hypothetical protein
VVLKRKINAGRPFWTLIFSSQKVFLILLMSLIGFGTQLHVMDAGHATEQLANPSLKGRYRILYRRIDYGLFIIPLNFLK